MHASSSGTSLFPGIAARHSSSRAVWIWQAPPLLELGQAALEQAPLGAAVGQRERPLVGGARLGGAAEPAQQVAAGRVQVAVVAEVEAVDDVEPRLRAVRLRDGDRSAQLD